MLFMAAAKLLELPIMTGAGREFTHPETGDYWTIRNAHLGDESAHGFVVRMEPGEKQKGFKINHLASLRRGIAERQREIGVVQNALDNSPAEPRVQEVRRTRIAEAKAFIEKAGPEIEAIERELAEWAPAVEKLIPLESVRNGTAEVWW